ncbi:MAG TPA: hypothetical protein DCL21_03035 [Alphaproteobacteria bacterium]|nr:hypothetical protein [Alphaproteobacteria bacterium]
MRSLLILSILVMVSSCAWHSKELEDFNVSNCSATYYLDFGEEDNATDLIGFSVVNSGNVFENPELEKNVTSNLCVGGNEELYGELLNCVSKFDQEVKRIYGRWYIVEVFSVDWLQALKSFSFEQNYVKLRKINEDGSSQTIVTSLLDIEQYLNYSE